MPSSTVEHFRHTDGKGALVDSGHDGGGPSFDLPDSYRRTNAGPWSGRMGALRLSAHAGFAGERRGQVE